jgi:hypothetical protein
MSMSTNIDDLPGPKPIQDSEPINEYSDNSRIQQQDYEEIQPETNIKANIKKKVQFSDDVDYIENNENKSLTEWVKSEITEENLAILVFIYIAGLPRLDDKLMSLPYVNDYIKNEFVLGGLKALALLILFVITKRYILPKLKV